MKKLLAHRAVTLSLSFLPLVVFLRISYHYGYTDPGWMKGFLTGSALVLLIILAHAASRLRLRDLLFAAALLLLSGAIAFLADLTPMLTAYRRFQGVHALVPAGAGGVRLRARAYLRFCIRPLRGGPRPRRPPGRGGVRLVPHFQRHSGFHRAAADSDDRAALPCRKRSGGLRAAGIRFKPESVSAYMPALFIAATISLFLMNQRHTAPLRRFSALSRVMPTSMPITSGFTQPVVGLKASVKPYFP